MKPVAQKLLLKAGNRDVVARTLNEVGLQAVTPVAIDETWGALRAKIV